MAYKGYFQMTKEERLYKDWGLSCKHVSGLDLKDGARLLLKMDRDCFFIKRFWKVIATIPKNEICNISMETEEWVEIYYPKFSNFQALLGVATFGPLGALLGMPTKEPYEINRKMKFLVIEKTDGSQFVFYCDQWAPEFGDRQTPKKIVADFERGVGYAK